jgi:voltage-gated sodium channel
MMMMMMMIMMMMMMMMMIIIIIIITTTQHHSLRVACMNIIRTVPALTEVLLVLLVIILTFSWAATLLFAHLPVTNFGSFTNSLLQIYTLSTVTNFPSVTIPVFTEHRSAFLFFVLFLCVGVLLMMNLTFAIVYEV